MNASSSYLSERLFALSVRSFLFTIGFSLVGMLLLFIPPVVSFFAPVLVWLIKIPTWIYMALMPITVWCLYYRHLGLAKSLFFAVWGTMVGAVMELMGVAMGVPFGTYFYTDLLGPKMFNLVPYFIPPAWYAMGLLSYDLATRLGLQKMPRVFVAALFMMIWDMSLDPAMTYAQKFWVFPNGGFLFGMPAQNWFGWYVSAFIIMWGYEYLGHGLRPMASPWVGWLWWLNAAFPFLVSLVSLKFDAFLFGFVTSSIPFLALWSYQQEKDVSP